MLSGGFGKEREVRGVFPQLLAEGVHYGKDTWQALVGVPRGETVALTHTVTTSPAATEPLVIHQTPTARVFEWGQGSWRAAVRLALTGFGSPTRSLPARGRPWGRGCRTGCPTRPQGSRPPDVGWRRC